MAAESRSADLVDLLVDTGRVRSAHVAAAFRAVPRELFVPGVPRSRAYRDEAIVTRRDSDGRPRSSSSQPAMMAMMLEQLAVEPGQHVLEIGAGTGYNAALLGHLVGPAGRVVTVDIDQEVAAQAHAHLGAAGTVNVEVVTADGADGWPTGAPYDRIIVTASVADIAAAWLSQLTDPGRIVMPLSLGGMQRSIAFARAGQRLSSVSILECGFMPLRGRLAGEETARPLAAPGVFLDVRRACLPDRLSVLDALSAPGLPVPVPCAYVTDAEILGGLGLWIMVHARDAALLTAVGPALDAGLLPVSRSFPDMTMAIVVLGPDGLAALARIPDDDPGSDGSALEVQPFGRDAFSTCPSGS